MQSQESRGGSRKGRSGPEVALIVGSGLETGWEGGAVDATRTLCDPC